MSSRTISNEKVEEKKKWVDETRGFSRSSGSRRMGCSSAPLKALNLPMFSMFCTPYLEKAAPSEDQALACAQIEHRNNCDLCPHYSITVKQLNHPTSNLSFFPKSGKRVSLNSCGDERSVQSQRQQCVQTQARDIIGVRRLSTRPCRRACCSSGVNHRQKYS